MALVWTLPPQEHMDADFPDLLSAQSYDLHGVGCLDDFLPDFDWWPLQPAQCPFEWHTLKTKELKWLITTLFDVAKK
jgi:hypothetical protein